MSDEKLPEYVEDAIAIDDPQGECPHCDARRAAIWRFVREQRVAVYEKCALLCEALAQAREAKRDTYVSQGSWQLAADENNYRWAFQDAADRIRVTAEKESKP